MRAPLSAIAALTTLALAGSPARADDAAPSADASPPAARPVPVYARLPPPPPPSPIPWERDVPMLASGAVLMGLGAIATAIGIGLLVGAAEDGFDESGCAPRCVDPTPDDDSERLQIAGGVSIAGGGVLLGAGIPLFVVGLKKRPRSAAAPGRLVVARF